MFTPVFTDQTVVAGGSLAPKSAVSFLSGCQKGWTHTHHRVHFLHAVSQIRPLAALAWGFAFLGTLSHLFGEALASDFVGGPAFRINSYTAGKQQNPSTAALSGGGFVVTWYGDGQGSVSKDIFGRKFDGMGVAMGTDFPINTFTERVQQNPSVATFAGDRFVVSWVGYGQVDSHGIFGRKFDDMAMPMGIDFPINIFATASQVDPSAAGLAGDGFVVTWYGRGQGDDVGVFGRRYNDAGAAIGNDFLINAFTTGFQTNPSAAGFAGGGFIVAWSGEGQSDSSGIFARRFDSTGMAMGNDFPINTLTTGGQQYPDVAALAGGGFVIAWQGPSQVSSSDIFGRCFDSRGVAMGNDISVNTYTAGFHQAPSVAALVDGGFVITWQGAGQGDAAGIFGRRFDSKGVAMGNEFPINAFTTGAQLSPSAVALTGGRIAVTWHGQGQSSVDYDIYARIFTMSTIATSPHATTQEMEVTTTVLPVSGTPSLLMPSTATKVANAATSTALPLPFTDSTASSRLSRQWTTLPSGTRPLTPIPDLPGDDVVIGLGITVALLVCGILSALGVVMVRRRQLAIRAANQEEKPPAVDAASTDQGNYGILPRRISSNDGRADRGVSSLPSTNYGALELIEPGQYAFLELRPTSSPRGSPDHTSGPSSEGAVSPSQYDAPPKRTRQAAPQ